MKWTRLALIFCIGINLTVHAQTTFHAIVRTDTSIKIGSHEISLPAGTRVTILKTNGTESIISSTDADGSAVISHIPSSDLKSLATLTSPSAGTILPTRLESIDIYVSPTGSDQNSGAFSQPVASLVCAQQLAQRARSTKLPVNVYLRDGTYYISSPLIFTPDDSGSAQAPVTYQAYKKEKPVVSGGVKLSNLNWQPFQNGIMQAKVPDYLKTDQMFVNGERQIMARYPNFDPNVPIFNGHAADAISPARVTKWKNPAGGFYHAMHPALWGDFSYEITGKTADGKLTLSGGWQNNRPSTTQHDFVGEVPNMNDARFVENIFEELDAPSEWFLNTNTHVLYYYPPAGLDLNHATLEFPLLPELIALNGTENAPIKFLSFKGLIFRHTLRTFMDTEEPIVRSDWALYRGGAIFINGTEDCSLEESFLDQLGGNGVFVNNYNRRFTIEGCHISQTGANGIVFLGDPKSARNPLFNADAEGQSYHAIDKTPGPQNNNFPSHCLVDNCLIHETGRVEKQTAPIEIDLAQEITVRHCSIYNVPRAGINIGDGCWGGHVIEYCDVFDTVKETGDHGSFNSWGRDRWWKLTDIDLNTIFASPNLDLPRLDALKPTIIRNNRWRCDHGWDIDLDDGSSNYEIRNNLCLNGGIKNREGFYRVVENNIMVNNSFCPHVWYRDSQDIFQHNLVWDGYHPALMGDKPWGKEMDHNLVVKVGMNGTQPAKELQNASGRDEHSVDADPLFIDSAHGDYRVRDGSPALAMGFINFPMDQFGVQKPELAAIALTPPLPGGEAAPHHIVREDSTAPWNGAQIRNIRDENEMSAYGLPGVRGALVLQVDSASSLAKAGLQTNDVIQDLDGKPISQVSDLVGAPPSYKFQIKISRKQKQITLEVE